MTDPTTPPGWYDDGNGAQRYWDGVQWTDQTQAPGEGTQAGQPMPGFPSLPPPSAGVNKKVLGIAAAAAGLVLVVVVVLAVAFSGGGSPEDVAEDYLRATVEFDVETVCELSTEDEQESVLATFEADRCSDLDEDGLREYASNSGELGDLEDAFELRDDLEVDVEILDVTEDGDEAEVEFRGEVRYNGDDQALFESVYGDEETDTGTVTLKKVDGDWLVDELDD